MQTKKYTIVVVLAFGIMTSQGVVLGAVENLIETTYDDANWVIVTSDILLRENLCGYNPMNRWYEKVFNPCYGQSYNRYWRLEPNEQTGRAFPMGYEPDGIGKESFDSFYVRDGYGFQIYDNETYPSNPNDLIPYGPPMVGPQYVSLTYWQYPAPEGFEPGTFFVVGGEGDLERYSIIIYANPLSLEKTDAIENGYDCVSPVDANKDQITYTITYENPSEGNPYYMGTLHDVNITDYLAKEVDFNWVSGPNSTYEPGPRRVRWEIGNLEPGQSGSVMLGVTVNELAEPVGIIRNSCTIGPNSLFVEVADTNVCCWNPGVIYVDDMAADTGLNTGMSWENAYLDLQSAIIRASECFCNEIWVAQGEYTPSVPTSNKTFNLIDGVKMYGGYPSGGGQRDWLNNETILKKGSGTVSYVVTASGVGDETVIDGFTVRDAGEGGILCNQSSSLLVSHVHLIYNGSFGGIYCNSSNPTIANCIIANNSGPGIYCSSSGYPVVRNSTIADNVSYGIEKSGTGILESISNCILWYNNNDGTQVYHVTPNYSCIQNGGGGTNIGSNPLFVDANGGNYHLRYNSPCIDSGDSNVVEPNETDIDGEPRFDPNYNDRVDMGSDEAYPPCWSCPSQCHADSEGCDRDVDTVDWPYFRDGFGKSFPNPVYISNACGDYNHDGAIDTVDWPQFRDWFGKTPPADCLLCFEDPNRCWPPGQSQGKDSGEGKSNYSKEEYDAFLEEMLKWLEEYQPPGWEEFIKQLFE
jgi:parallel beta-helix repeat protein